MSDSSGDEHQVGNNPNAVDELQRVLMRLTSPQVDEIQQQLESTITELKTKHNRMLSDHEDKFAKDAKFVI